MKRSWKKKIGKVIGIIIAIDIIMWFIGMLLMIISDGKMQFANIIILVSSLIIGIPVFFGMFGGIAYISYLLVKDVLKNSSVLVKIISWIIILGIINMFIGTVICFFGSPFESYNVEEVKVVDVKGNKLEIDYTSFNQGDNKTIMINKPILIKIDKGDYINVRYPINQPEKMHYVIDSEVGFVMIIIGSIMLFVWLYIGMIIFIISIPYNLIKNSKVKKKRKKKIR